MSKPSRRKLRVMPPGKDQVKLGNGAGGKVEKAVERVVAQGGRPDVVPIPLHPEPVRLTEGKGIRIKATATADTEAVVLVFDGRTGLWRAVLLPPGSEWALAPAAKPKPALWTPPK